MSDHVTLVGTVASDPRTIGEGTATQLCKFRLASNDRRYHREKGEWVDGPTNWFTINVFRGLGEHAQASFHKGDRVLLHGRLRVRKWESDQKSGTSVEVDAEALGHDLRWGTSSFTKLSKSKTPSSAGDESSTASSTSQAAHNPPADEAQLDDAIPPF